MKWLNALGLLLQFISFWLVAPEILGTKTLSRISDATKKIIGNLSVIIIFSLVAFYGIGFSLYGIITGFQATSKTITASEMTNYYIKIGVATTLYFIFILNFKKFKIWLETKISGPLIENLIQNEDLRRNSLLAGGILFSIGFIIQFIVILLQPS